MNFARTCVAIGVVVTFSACTMSVTTDYDPAADFSRFRTYSWHPDAGRHTGDPTLDNSLLRSRIRRAVERTLAGKGFFEAVEADDADLLVAYQVTRTTKYMPSFTEPGWSSGLPTEVDQYDEGSLIIDFIDPEGERLLWRGTASTQIDESASPKRREATINEGVQRILEGFPPSTGIAP